MGLPLKWHGGKAYLAKRIIELMPRHRHYVEPYAGGLAVLLARDPADPELMIGADSSNGGVSEVVNDLHRELTNFWTVLQYDKLFVEMQRRLEATPLSRLEWDSARAYLNANPLALADSKWLSVNHAIAFFVCCRQSLAGRLKSFTPLTRNRTRRGMNGNASEWLGAVDGLPAVHERLRSVVIENMDALDLIRREDTRETLFYCDPPYLHETRSNDTDYQHEMTEMQHTQLLIQLGALNGQFLLSGYPHPLYLGFAKRHHWQCHEFTLPNNAAGGVVKRRMTECLWSNARG